MKHICYDCYSGVMNNGRNITLIYLPYVYLLTYFILLYNLLEILDRYKAI